jgi:glycosyltransferase involved in cell wall biosynthesis
MTPQISVCIPAYDMHGAGAEMLEAALASASVQHSCDFEVVIADQACDGSLIPVCARWAGRMILRRIDSTDTAKGSAANLNRAIAAARGRIVKVLFQDDCLGPPDALLRIAAAFDNPATVWMLCGWTDWRGPTGNRDLVPRLNPMLPMGRNSVGHPSALAIRRDMVLEFDPAFDWLMDVDYYHRCLKRFGPPVIEPAPLVRVRRHASQHSHRLDAARRRAEVRQAMHKHGLERSPRAWLYYLTRVVLLGHR